MIPYTLVRSQRKTVAIQVTPEGAVVVRAPRRMPAAAIEDFVARETPWVERARAKALAAAANCPAVTPAEGETLPFRDGTLRLHIGGDLIRIEGAALYLPAGTDADALRLWLKATAQETLAARLAYFAAKMDVPLPPFRLSDAQTRWGSCSPKNALCLSWRLLLCPAAALDYVVVHELCHLFHKNHGRDFYALLGRVLPGYKAQQRWLKENTARIRVL